MSWKSYDIDNLFSEYMLQFTEASYRPLLVQTLYLI